MQFCEKCGAQVREEDGFCAVCDAKQKEAERVAKIERIERQVADYYNQNKRSSEDGEKYIVVHEETKEFEDKCHIVVRFLDEEAIAEKSLGKAIATVSVNIETGECTILTKPERYRTKAEGISGRNVFCVFLVVCAMVLWLLCPFVATNIFTIGDQPTALNIVLGNFLYFGDLAEQDAFWAAAWMGIGSLICLFCLLGKSSGATRFFAILTAGFPILIVAAVLSEGGTLEALFPKFGGIGFWGIGVIMILITFICEKQW